MIRIAHISDSHFDERGRLQDDIDLHRAFIKAADDEQVDLILHTGDLYERRSTPAERLAVRHFLEEASDFAPVVIVQGNHEAQLDVDLWDRFAATGAPVHVLTRPVGAVLGTALVLELTAGKVGILGLPWFDKAHLVAQLGAEEDQERTRQKTIATAGQLLAGFVAEANRLRGEGIVPIMGAHVLVAGSEVSSGQTIIGTTVELSPADLLEIPAAYIGLGHVHKAQEWGSGRMAYAGSPKRCDFGEPEAKGWRLVTIAQAETGQLPDFVSSEFRELPARAIVLEELEDALVPCLDERPDLTGALVRVRFPVSKGGSHDPEIMRRAYLAAGAEEVKVEPIIEAQAAVRVQEIVETTSVADKATVYWKAKGLELDEPAIEELQAKIGQLEEEVRHEAR